KVVQSLKHLLGLLQLLHLNAETAGSQRQQEKMEATQGRSRKAVIVMAPAPSCRQPHAWTASPRHQKCLSRTGVALIAMHMSRHHREGFRALEKWRHKRRTAGHRASPPVLYPVTVRGAYARVCGQRSIAFSLTTP